MWYIHIQVRFLSLFSFFQVLAACDQLTSITFNLCTADNVPEVNTTIPIAYLASEQINNVITFLQTNHSCAHLKGLGAVATYQTNDGPIETLNL